MTTKTRTRDKQTANVGDIVTLVGRVGEYTVEALSRDLDGTIVPDIYDCHVTPVGKTRNYGFPIPWSSVTSRRAGDARAMID